MFTAGRGNYGSTMWDTMSATRALDLNVCDECLVAHSDRVAVRVTLPKAPPDPTFEPWDPDKEY